MLGLHFNLYMYHSAMSSNINTMKNIIHFFRIFLSGQTKKLQGEKWFHTRRSTWPLNLQVLWLLSGLRQSYRIAVLAWQRCLLSDSFYGIKTSVIVTTMCNVIAKLHSTYLSYDPEIRVCASNGWNFNVWTWKITIFSTIRIQLQDHSLY